MSFLPGNAASLTSAVILLSFASSIEASRGRLSPSSWFSAAWDPLPVDIDPNSNRERQVETNAGRTQTTEYTHDFVNRLKTVTYPDKTTAYDYDKSGNRIQEVTTGAEASDKTFHYDAINRLERITDSTSGAELTAYSYDPNGNTTSKTSSGVTTNFFFDIRDQLGEVRQGPSILGRYGYDYDGRRILKIGDDGRRQYTYDQLSVITEADQANTTVSKYDYGMDQLVRLDNRSEGRSFFHLDGLRSTVGLTDSAGSSRQSIFYDAWGNERDRIGSSANNFTFTGHELDEETGLIYAKARFYDAEIGRFLTQDSMLGNPANAPSLHRYAYAENRPTIFTDPTGRITAKGFARGLFGVVAEPFAEILDIGIVTYAQQEGLDVGRVPLYSSLGRAQRSRLLEGQGTASTSLSGTADVAYAVGTFGIGPFIEGHIQLAQAVAAGEITIDEYDEGVSQLAGGATAVAVLASIAESSSGRGWRGNQTGRSAQQPSISEGEPTGKIITEKAGTDAQPSAEPAKTTRSAAEQLRLNKAQADAFEGELGEVLRQRQADVQEQVSIKPNTEEGPASFRFRPDFLGKEGGEIVVTEGKSSETAPLTPRQAEGIPLLEEYGGTVVGKKGGDAFPAGTVLPPGTKVNIVRPADVLVLRGFKPPLALSPPRKCDENGLCSP